MEKRQKTITVFVTEDGVEHLTEGQAELHEIKLMEQKQLSVQQLRNEQSLAEHRARIDAVHLEWKQNPSAKEDFIQFMKCKHMAHMELGRREGLWEDVTPNGDPIPFPMIVSIASLEPNETTMAHILAKLEIFPSVTQARKNGFDKPIVEGEFWFQKKTKRIRIVP